eukprot:223698_1
MHLNSHFCFRFFVSSHLICIDCSLFIFYFLTAHPQSPLIPIYAPDTCTLSHKYNFCSQLISIDCITLHKTQRMTGSQTIPTNSVHLIACMVFVRFSTFYRLNSRLIFFLFFAFLVIT